MLALVGLYDPRNNFISHRGEQIRSHQTGPVSIRFLPIRAVQRLENLAIGQASLFPAAVLPTLGSRQESAIVMFVNLLVDVNQGRFRPALCGRQMLLSAVATLGKDCLLELYDMT